MYKDCRVLMLLLGVPWWNKIIIKNVILLLDFYHNYFFHQPFKLKFSLGQVASFKILGAMAWHGRNLKSCQLFLPYCFRSFVLSSKLFLHSDLFRFLLFSGVLLVTVSLIAVFYNAPDYVCFEMRSSL